MGKTVIIQRRITEEQKAELDRRCEASGKTISQLIGEALGLEEDSQPKEEAEPVVAPVASKTAAPVAMVIGKWQCQVDKCGQINRNTAICTRCKTPRPKS